MNIALLNVALRLTSLAIYENHRIKNLKLYIPIQTKTVGIR